MAPSTGKHRLIKFYYWLHLCSTPGICWYISNCPLGSAPPSKAHVALELWGLTLTLDSRGEESSLCCPVCDSFGRTEILGEQTVLNHWLRRFVLSQFSWVTWFVVRSLRTSQLIRITPWKSNLHGRWNLHRMLPNLASLSLCSASCSARIQTNRDWTIQDFYWTDSNDSVNQRELFFPSSSLLLQSSKSGTTGLGEELLCGWARNFSFSLSEINTWRDVVIFFGGVGRHHQQGRTNSHSFEGSCACCSRVRSAQREKWCISGEKEKSRPSCEKNIRRRGVFINKGGTACFWLVLTSPTFCNGLQNQRKVLAIAVIW